MNEDQIVKPIPLDIAKKLVRKHFPELIDKEIVYRGGGSFSVFTVGEEIVLRLSKSWADNQEMIDAFQREKSILDEIRSQIEPHSIPDHINVFEDKDIFEGLVWVTKQFNGEPLSKLITKSNQDKVVKLIADFLSRLHSLDPKKVKALEAEYNSKSKIRESWFKNYENNKRDHFSKLTKEEENYMHRVYDKFLSLADDMKPIQVITHGDFDHSNCMWNPNENHLQVIDCEDIDIGHAVGDFCTWYGNYGEEFLMKLIDSYELKVDKYFVERAKFYWLRIPLFYFSYAIEHNNEKFIDFARHLLEKNMSRFRL